MGLPLVEERGQENEDIRNEVKKKASRFQTFNVLYSECQKHNKYGFQILNNYWFHNSLVVGHFSKCV